MRLVFSHTLLTHVGRKSMDRVFSLTPDYFSHFVQFHNLNRIASDNYCMNKVLLLR